ncbi:hypothetical protein HRbin12_01653 [bacterium HR12]|nr:hypothetical protein HRbin12_01653 [bacterium HR12]
MPPERVQYLGERHGVGAERGELRERHPPPGVTGPGPEADQPEEHLERELPLGFLESRVRLLGPTGHDPVQPTEPAVPLDREPPIGPALEQLGERELEERERARLPDRIRDERREQRGLDLGPDPARGPQDRQLHPVGGHRQDAHDPRDEGVGERGVQERPVVEVAAEGQHHPDASVGFLDHHCEGREEPLPVRLSGRGEQLLELVHDEEEVPAGDAVPSRRLQRRGRILAGSLDPRQGRSQLLERARAGQDPDDRPRLGARYGAAPDRRDESRVHDAGLPAARRTDQGDESTALAEHPQQRPDEFLAPEEVLRVLLVERPQPLVGVPNPSGGRGSGWCEGRVVEQDPLLESAERRRGIEPELLGQESREPLVDAQRLRVSPRPVEGEHLELARAFPQRVLGGRPLEERERVLRASELELGRRELLDRVQVEPLETADLGLSEPLVREVRQRRASPEVERRTERGGPTGRIARGDRAGPLEDPLLEPPSVDAVGLDAEQVPGGPCLDHRSSVVGPQRPAELRDVQLDRVSRGPGRMLPPDQLDQSVRRDDLADVQEQDREDRPLLRRPQPDVPVVGDDLERPEDPVLHAPPPT